MLPTGDHQLFRLTNEAGGETAIVAKLSNTTSGNATSLCLRTSYEDDCVTLAVRMWKAEALPGMGAFNSS